MACEKAKFLSADQCGTDSGAISLARASGSDLVLKGGQALRHVYGSARFSKDVDYAARRRFDYSDLRHRNEASAGSKQRGSL